MTNPSLNPKTRMREENRYFFDLDQAFAEIANNTQLPRQELADMPQGKLRIGNVSLQACSIADGNVAAQHELSANDRPKSARRPKAVDEGDGPRMGARNR